MIAEGDSQKQGGEEEDWMEEERILKEEEEEEEGEEERILRRRAHATKLERRRWRAGHCGRARRVRPREEAPEPVSRDHRI